MAAPQSARLIGDQMSKRKIFGDCLVVTGDDIAARRALLERIVLPAWYEAGGVEAPKLLEEAARGGTSLECLAEARIVFIDITGGDPSALYYLGVRDALACLLTIPLHRGQLPDCTPASLARRAISVDDAQKAIAQIGERLVAIWQKDDAFQSPVAASLPGLRVVTRAHRPLLGEPVSHLWSITTLDERGRPTAETLATRIGILCGDLAMVRGIDVWVNSENTLMEMGRMCDAGISALIRRLGAKGAGNANFVDDVIQRELMHAVGGRNRPVEDGAVFWTRPGNLSHRGVRRIAHVAAVRPREPMGSGYVPVADLGRCVTTVLNSLGWESSKHRLRTSMGKRAPLKSILFPLMGTGTAQDDARVVSGALISAAVDYLREKRPPHLERVLFLAASDVDAGLCRNAFAAIAGLAPASG
jgi:O-acetyl-ADP-ribose deacetylase (regulator of RNase III)